MKTLALTVVLFFALAGTATAHSFDFHPSLAHRSLAGRAAGQRLVIYHDRAMIRLLRPFVAARLPTSSASIRLEQAFHFHAAQLRWTTSELRQTMRALRSKDRESSFGGGWLSGLATWYGPGFYGHSPSCGGNGVLTEGSMWAASMTLGCGTPVTICTHRCVHTTIEDTGAFSATFDLAPGLAGALGCHCTQTVRWRRG